MQYFGVKLGAEMIQIQAGSRNGFRSNMSLLKFDHTTTLSLKK